MALSFFFNNMSEEGKAWFNTGDNGYNFCLTMLAAGVPVLKTDADLWRYHDRCVALELWHDHKASWKVAQMMKGLSTNGTKRTEADIAKAALQVQKEKAAHIRREAE